jgi:hypothetical protein
VIITNISQWFKQFQDRTEDTASSPMKTSKTNLNVDEVKKKKKNTEKEYNET